MRVRDRRFQCSVPLLCLLVLASSTACMSWRVQHMTPSRVVNEKRPGRVRVTLMDSTRVVLRDPTVVGDSLVGVPAGAPRALALVDVTRVEIRGVSALKTVGLVYLIAAAVGLGIAAGGGACCGY